MGQAPATNAVSVRTFNRNFYGRSGTASAKVYLTGPETAAATAIAGVLTDASSLGLTARVEMPQQFLVDDSMIIPPAADPEKVEVVRGPNIKPLPVNTELPDTLQASVLLKVEDNITTDHIMPAGAKILPLRSNIPAISAYVFSQIDPTFADRAKSAGSGVVVGGHNYGQGSSREHAALAPMNLGVKAVIAKSFARIHHANLVNFGILPLTFVNEADYDKINRDDKLEIRNLRAQLAGKTVTVHNLTTGETISVYHNLSPRQVGIVTDGGLLNHTKKQNA
jgi:aconitate hydratase